MDEITLNGDIYLKILPDIETRYQVNKIGKMTTVTFQGKTLNVAALTQTEIGKLPLRVKELLRTLGIISVKTECNDNNNGFYQIWYNIDSVYMLNKKDNVIFHYPDMEDIKLKYLNLWEYLNRATYVGVYLINPGQPMLEYLYNLNGMYLLRNAATGEYLVISNGNPILKGYFSKDNIKTNHYDINSVYQEIVAQIIKSPEGKMSR